MRIDKIEIKNFRAYRDLTLAFGNRCTVFIGKNGSGKSSVISALRKGLSFVFSENKGEINPLKSNNNATVRSFSITDTRYDDATGFNWPTSLKYEVTFGGMALKWEFFKKGDPGGLHSTLYRDARNTILEALKQDSSTWPLLAFFGDSYPHHEMNFGAKASKVIKSDSIPMDFAYYGWDEYQNCNVLWFERFKYIDNYLFDINRKIEGRGLMIIDQQIKMLEELLKSLHTEADKQRNLDILGQLEELRIQRKSLVPESIIARRELFASEKKYIEDRIVKFTGPASEKYRFINDEFAVSGVSASKIAKSDYSVRFEFAKGGAVFAEMLPMGYKRLLHIVFDLAYRAFILTKGEREPQGVVMIDEVELHLHPTLQQEVIHRFQNAFPEIQFVFSTHSPLAISNILVDGEACKLIKLDVQDGNYTMQYVGNIYGIDYATSLTEVMGAKHRKSEIDRLVDSIVILLTKNMEEKAHRLKTELFNIVGNDNDFIEREIRNRVQMNKK